MAKKPLWLKKHRIAVLAGGISEEREVSLKSGRAVFKALKELQLNPIFIQADKNLDRVLRHEKITYAVNLLHGHWGEDGTVQGLLESLGIAYWGSQVSASAIAMDKVQTKRILLTEKIATAPFCVCTHSKEIPSLPLPLAIKPADGGSAIGVSIVRNSSAIRKALKTTLRYSSRALCEQFIAGRELTVPVLGERTLPAVEIIPEGKFYDYRSKYAVGGSRHVVPAPMSSKKSAELSAIALAVHRAVGARGFSRVDFIVDARNRPWVLEINTLPGMTETSLFPEAARAVGLTFSDLVLAMLHSSPPQKKYKWGAPQLPS